MRGRISDLFSTSPEAEAIVKSQLRLSWTTFVEKVFEIDAQLMAQGIEPQNRPLRVVSELSRLSNTTLVIGGVSPPDAVVTLVHLLYDMVYGKENLVVGPIHVGAIRLRDVFFVVRVPLVFGRVSMDYWDHVEGIKRQSLEAFYAVAPEEYFAATDQLMDIFDFGWAHMDEGRSNHRWCELLTLAKEQIEGACQTVFGAFSKRVAAQGSAYAVELGGKALLSKVGFEDEALVKLGHNLKKIIAALCDAYPSADRDLLSYAAGQIPFVVGERYNFSALTRLQIGHTLGCAQYCLGEYGRLVSDRNSRAGARPPLARSYPKSS